MPNGHAVNEVNGNPMNLNQLRGAQMACVNLCVLTADCPPAKPCNENVWGSIRASGRGPHTLSLQT